MKAKPKRRKRQTVPEDSAPMTERPSYRCMIRKRFPKYERLDFRAEAELVRKKKSKWPAADRATILRVVEAIESDEGFTC